MTSNEKPVQGEEVLLLGVPRGLLSDLPAADQAAIAAAVGRPVRVTNYEADGRVEVEFTDEGGTIHFLYVEPSQIKTITPKR